jgi:tetratricopeptide (TPR) repeat protein
VLVLVDEAVPARLGELTRSLLPGHPELEVHTDALRLARAAEGALVILVPDPAQASWLNMERPLFANRALRTILFSSAETTGVLARRAPDFFSWISHHIPCPPGLPLPALRGVQAALCARAPGVVWRGGDLHAVFEAALPGRPLAEVSAALPYADLVRASKPEGRGWVAWSEVDGPFRLRRVRWAAAEAGRRGRSLLVAPSVEAPGFAGVDGRLIELAEARGLLEEAGAPFPGRLAALLELEREAVMVAVGLLWAGVSAGEIEAAVLAADDAGAAVAKMAAARGIEGAAPLRARRGEGRGAGGDPVEEMVRAGKWGDAAEGALAAGDPQVALPWAMRIGGDAAEELRRERVVGRALTDLGRYGEAEATLRAALATCEKMFGDDSAESANLCRELAIVLRDRERYIEARALLERALAVHEKGPTVDLASSSADLYELAGVVMKEGDLPRAEALCRRFIALGEKAFGADSPSYGSYLVGAARVLRAAEKDAEAEGLLRRALDIQRATRGREHPFYASSLCVLASVLGSQGREEEALRVIREALAIHAKVLGSGHPSYADDLRVLCGVLLDQGEFVEAEVSLRKAIAINEKTLGTTHPAHMVHLDMLAGILQMQGRYAESEALLRQVLSSSERALGAEDPSRISALCSLAGVLVTQGRAEEGEAVAERALSIAEASYGAVHAKVGTPLFLVAVIRAQLGKSEARANAQRALDMLLATRGPEYEETRMARSLVAILDPAYPALAAPPSPR